MNKSLLVASLFILSASILKGGTQAIFYVSPNGSGTNFSQAQPGNLLDARNQIRTLTPSMSGDLVVYLYGGIYSLTNGFQLSENSTNHDSGTGGYNVIYQAYPGTIPILSGGINVSGWTIYNKTTNIWRAYVGTGVNSRQLYVNGVRAIRARGPLDPSGFFRTTAGFTAPDSTMATWGNITNIEIVDRNDWKQLRCPISSISRTAITMQNPGWNLIGISPQPGHPWNGGGSNSLNYVSWIENAYELLRSPGMWYLNRATGYLYYIPRPGENMTTATVVLPVAEKLIDASGENLTTPIHNIIFSGITFEYATWLLPSTGAGYADNQTSIMWGSLNSALKTLGNVSFQTVSNIQLTNNVFTHLGGSAVDFGNGAHGNTIAGNHIEDISGCGITLGEVNDYNTSNTNQMTDRNVIQNNYIRQVGAEYEDDIGIWVGYAKNTLIAHNDVANIPYTGISVGWGWGTDSYASNNQVNANYVGNSMQTLSDGAAFYTLSKQADSRTIGNYFKDSCANGIYWDEGTADYIGLSNVVDNCSGWWVNMWIYTIYDCIATNNFSNVRSANNSGTDCVITNTTYVPGQNWPSAAQEIIQNAGLESAYKQIQLPISTVNDNATNFTYHGNWISAANPLSGDYNGDVHISTNAGDYVDFVFYGTSVSAICQSIIGGGNVDVYLDDVLQTTASTGSPYLQPQQTVFSTNNLSVQTHTLRLLNDGGQVGVDAFVMRGASEIIINDAVAVFDHVPSDWSYSSDRHTGDYHSDVHATQTSGQYVQYTFVGPTIAWIGEMDPSEGSAQVYLDGILQATVNCYSATRIAQQRLFSAVNLSPGSHTLKLVNASNAYMVVDAFAVTPTLPVPVAPEILSALGGTNQIDLSWIASVDAMGYVVARAAVTGGPYTVIGSLLGTNITDIGLTAGTTYYYVVAATNSSGVGANSTESNAITIPMVTQGISAVPAGLHVTVTGLQAGLSWSASPGAVNYNIKRAVTSGGPYTIIASSSGTGFIDVGLAKGTTYYYVISAVNVYGESLNSIETSGTTAPDGGLVYQNTVLMDNPVGYWPLDLSKDTNYDSSGNLLAADVSGNGNTGTYRYIIANSKSAGPSIFLPNAVSFDGVTTYVDLSTGGNENLLNIGGKITMEAWVKPASGNTYGDIMAKGYDSSLNSQELEMRANGGNYHAGVYNGTINDQAADGGSETTNWTYVVATYDGATWNLYINGIKVNATASTNGAVMFNDPWAIGSGTADGLSRCFTGSICQAALYTNALADSQIATHYLRGRIGLAPVAPMGLNASPRASQVSLSWTPSIGATNYSIKRALTPGGPYTVVGAAAGTGFVDSGLTNGTTYYYVVSETNSAGGSVNSAEVNATPLAIIPITLNAQLQSGGTFGFTFAGQSNQNCVVETSTNLIDWVAILTNTSTDGQFTFDDTNPSTANRFYRIRQ